MQVRRIVFYEIVTQSYPKMYYNRACSLFPIAFKIGLWSHSLSHSLSKDSQTIESDTQITTNTRSCNICVPCGTEEMVFLRSLVLEGRKCSLKVTYTLHLVLYSKTCRQVSKHVLFSSMERLCVFFTYTLQHILIEDLLITLQWHMEFCSPHILE